MPHFYIKHKTTYFYSDVIHESAFKIRLYPIIDSNVKVIKHNLQISFNPIVETKYDFFKNKIGTFSVVEPHTSFIIDSYLELITIPFNIPESTDNLISQWQAIYNLHNKTNFYHYLQIEYSNVNKEMNQLIDSFRVNQKSPITVIKELCNYVYSNFTYTKDITNVKTTLAETWNLKAGVCQDFTNVLLQLLKMSKIPARYVSGYISSNSDGFVGHGATHAWVEAYLPYAGWVGVDPTNNCLVTDKHVRIAVGRNYYDCAPVVGVYRGNATNQLEVEVEVGYDGIEKQTPVIYTEISNNLEQNSFALHQKLIQEQQQQ